MRLAHERKYREENREKENERKNEWRKKNKERVAQRRKELYDLNSSKIIESSKKYYYENKKDVNKKRSSQQKDRRKTDINFRIIGNLRARLSKVIKSSLSSKQEGTLDYIGCSKEELKLHLEKQFSEGMSWENYGEWHIDHRVPFNFYKVEMKINEDTLNLAMNWTNLQPLWAEDNIRKGGSY